MEQVVTPLPLSPQQPAQWHPLRVTYQRELLVSRKLAELGVEHFVPMRRVRVPGGRGSKAWRTEPAVHNYVFVRAPRARIQQLKDTVLPMLRFMVGRDANGLRTVLTVPDGQMHSFMAVAGSEDDVRYLEPGAPDLCAGERVRVTVGPFAGVVGTFVRLGSRAARSVVVEIPGILAVATTTIPAAHVERVEG